MEKIKPTRLRFTYEDDLVLLKEFLSNNPIVNSEGWDLIQRNMLIISGKNFLIKTLKQHLQLLIDLFLKKEKVDEVRSGIEEPYCEKNVLLQEVSSLCEEHKYDFKQKRKAPNKEQRITELGKKARDEFAHACVSSQVIVEEPIQMPQDHDYFFCENIPVCEEEIVAVEHKMEQPLLPPTQACSTPARSKNCNIPLGGNQLLLGPLRSRTKRGEPLKRNALLYLNEKNERENKIRIKELELEERKIIVEEKKILLQEKELKLKEKEIDLHHQAVMAKLEVDKKRADVEVEEKKITNNLMQSHQKLIDELLKRKH